MPILFKAYCTFGDKTKLASSVDDGKRSSLSLYKFSYTDQGGGKDLLQCFTYLYIYINKYLQSLFLPKTKTSI